MEGLMYVHLPAAGMDDLLTVSFHRLVTLYLVIALACTFCSLYTLCAHAHPIPAVWVS